MNKKYILATVVFLLIAHLSKSEELPDSVSNQTSELTPVDKVDYFIKLSWDLKEKETENALLYGFKAIHIADSLQLGDKLGRANNNVGLILLHYKYKPKEAVPYLHNALELASENDDSINIAYAFNNLGDVYYLTGNAPLAHDYANKSMKYCKALKDSIAIAYTRINYGLVHLLEKNYDKSLENLFKAIEIRKKFDNKLGVASVYQQVGTVYLAMGDLAKAEQFFELAFRKNKEIDNKKWMAFSLDGMGRIHFQEGRYEEALKYFNEALNLNEARNHLYGSVDNKLGIALVYSKLNKKKQGELLLEETLVDARKLALPIKLLDTYKTITQFYLNVNDFKEANKSFEKYDNVYDSLYMEQQFETLLEVQNNAEINQRLKASEYSLEIKKIEELYFIVIIFLLAVLAVVIFWRYLTHKSLSKQLKESNEAKDKLFSIISHDLRNTFHTLMGLLDLLKDKELSNEEKQELIDTFDSATRSTYQLLENLLSLSATKRGKIAFYPEEIEIKSLVDSILQSIQPQLKEKRITIEKNVDDFKVTADKKMLEIILRNIITNALKYSYKESVIKISSDVGEKFCLSVEDNGIGMDEETKNLLFKSEFQNSQHGTAGEKGTGIGLSLCKEFIEMHNGTIYVESEFGQGSKFTFCLPIKKS